MNIAWIKYCGPMELGYHLLGTQGNTDLRTSIFRELLKQGHNVTNYSPLTRETAKYLAKVPARNPLSKLVNQIGSAVAPGTDLLMVECGPTNVTYQMSISKGVQMSSVAYANQIISNYQGVVFYQHSDMVLPMVFFPEYYTVDFTNGSLKYGGFCNLQNNKTWSVLTPGLNLDDFSACYNGPRNAYRVLEDSELIIVQHFEPHYGCLYRWDKYAPNPDPEYVISYVGGERNRLLKFEKFMAKPSRNMEVNLWGRWTEKTLERFPLINYHGLLPKGETPLIYNNSVATIIIADIICENLGQITGRFFETVTAKSVPLVDVKLAQVTNLRNMLSPELLAEITVRNHADVLVKVRRMQKDPDYRLALIDRLVTECKQYSARDSVGQLLALHAQQSVLHKQRMRAPDKIRSAAISAFNSLQRERIADPTEFNKLVWEAVNTQFYKTNVPVQKPPYMLVPGAQVRPVALPDGYRCYKCGTAQVDAPRTRFLCDSCKADPAGRVEVMNTNYDKFHKSFKTLNK